MFEILTAAGKSKKPSPVGEIIFPGNASAAANFTWVVPEGVEYISGVGISGGGTGGGGSSNVGGGGGGGGGTYYFNDCKVSVGDVFTISIGADPVSYSFRDGALGGFVRVSRNSVFFLSIDGGAGGIYGGSGGAGGAGGIGFFSNYVKENSRQYYNSPGLTGRAGNSFSGGLGASPGAYQGQSLIFGTSYQSPYGINGKDAIYGRGGAGGSPSNSSARGARAVFRIIWGDNRSFPSNAA